MPTIISASYFKDKLFIPNSVVVPDIQSPSNGAPTNISKLDGFIEKYERLLLVNALGSTQYTELMSHLEDTTGKWYDLINGKTYDNKVYNGLKDIIGYYVYVCFLKYDHSQYNTTGIERSNAANSLSQTNTDRLIDFWNEFVVMYQSGYEPCGCSGSVWRFPFFWYDMYGSESNLVSLYQFLSDNNSDYTIEWFRFYEIQNTLGV